MSQASSCDYSMSQFRLDESQFVTKAEQGEGDDESQDCQYAPEEDPLKDVKQEEDDDEEDIPIVSV